MPTGSDIMERAAILLNDEDHVRWSLAELCDWINEAVRAIILAKPSASSHSQVLKLQEGTLQAVPTTGTPTPLALLTITRNLLTDADKPRAGGRMIRRADRSMLDAQEPYWHDKTRVPFKAEVRSFIFDELDPLEFYVYPGNTGTGIVEVVLSTLPAPLVASGAVDAVASYAGPIGLPEPYSVPVLDYVMFRAMGKDDLGGNAGRAAAHYQLFASAVGLKIRVEGAHSPNARK